MVRDGGRILHSITTHHSQLPPHELAVALIRPQIAENTGNVGRTCVASGAALHLVRPMGFVLDDRRIRRAGLDYWPRLDLTVHDSLEAFNAKTAARRRWWFDSGGTVDLFDVPFEADDLLVFGSETRGFDDATIETNAGRIVRIPQVPGERCLNLATSVGVALYAALARVSGARDEPRP